MPGWPASEPKLSIRKLAKKFSLPYTSLQKRVAGTVTSYAPSSGGGKGNPKILSKSIEGKLNQFTLFAHFFPKFMKTKQIHVLQGTSKMVRYETQ